MDCFQVITSSSQARSKLRSHFEHLKLCINEALDDRLRVLGQQVLSAEQAALKPLCQCEDLLQEKVNIAAGVLKEGLKMLHVKLSRNAYLRIDLSLEFRLNSFF